MRAIVLIGGKGTRLRPLTWRTPKQLVPILNRPLLAYLLDSLRSHGFDRVTFAMTGPDEDIEAAFTGDASPPGLAIERVLEGEPLGSGGAIANASSGWDEPFLVCNGDIVSDIDLGAFAGEHRERDAELSIALSEAEDPSRFGVVVLGEGDRVTRFVEKPPREEAPSRLINAGLWLFEPAVGRMLDADRFNRVEDELFPSLAAAGRGIFGHRHEGYWADIGNPEAYLQTNLDLLAGAAPALLPADWPADGLAIGAAELAAGARVEGPALLGAGTRVGADARIEGGVVTGAALRDRARRGRVRQRALGRRQRRRGRAGARLGAGRGRARRRGRGPRGRGAGARRGRRGGRAAAARHAARSGARLPRRRCARAHVRPRDAGEA